MQAMRAWAARGVFALAVLIGLQLLAATGMVSAQPGTERSQSGSLPGQAEPEPETPDARAEQDALKQRRSVGVRLVVDRTPDTSTAIGFPAAAVAAPRACARACAWGDQHRHLPAGDPSRRLQRSHAPPAPTLS